MKKRKVSYRVLVGEGNRHFVMLLESVHIMDSAGKKRATGGSAVRKGENNQCKENEKKGNGRGHGGEVGLG